jgi:hypothetical protein
VRVGSDRWQIRGLWSLHRRIPPREASRNNSASKPTWQMVREACSMIVHAWRWRVTQRRCRRVDCSLVLHLHVLRHPAVALHVAHPGRFILPSGHELAHLPVEGNIPSALAKQTIGSLTGSAQMLRVSGTTAGAKAACISCPGAPPPYIIVSRRESLESPTGRQCEATLPRFVEKPSGANTM